MSQPADRPELPPQYAPGDSERTLYKTWVERGYFTPGAKASDKPPYSIVIPPPNVTGQLHLGHAFEHTLMDALVRRRRVRAPARERHRKRPRAARDAEKDRRRMEDR